jgi:hypothetical protein
MIFGEGRRKERRGEHRWGIRRQQGKIEQRLQGLMTRLADETAGARKRRTTGVAAERSIRRLIDHWEAGPLLAWQAQQADGGRCR